MGVYLPRLCVSAFRASTKHVETVTTALIFWGAPLCHAFRGAAMEFRRLCVSLCIDENVEMAHYRVKCCQTAEG